MTDMLSGHRDLQHSTEYNSTYYNDTLYDNTRHSDLNDTLNKTFYAECQAVSWCPLAELYSY
jgi:hypothetical protein